jgi:1,4-dihydroxy-2-naphthoyl-CoA hydrolase
MDDVTDDASAPEPASPRPGSGAPREPVGFDAVLGLRLTDVGPDRVAGSFAVEPHLHQPHGILHGGVLCSVVESTASIGGALWFGDRGNVVGVANHTSFLRAVREGTLDVEATPVHRGRTQQLWSVRVRDAARRLVSQGEVRLANIASTDALAAR